MSIISPIGRKAPRTRLLYTGIYLTLILGACTMVYPFLLMLAGSTKSSCDLKYNRMIPQFFTDDAMLYRKHMEGLFNESIDAMNMAYGEEHRSFETVTYDPTHNAALWSEWRAFLAQADLPLYYWAPGYVQAQITKTIPSTLREFKQYLTTEFNGDITEANHAMGTDFVDWNAVFLLPEEYLLRGNMPRKTAYMEVYNLFKATQQPGNRYYFSVEGFYKKLFLKTQYSRDITEYNRTHGTAYADYDDVYLTRRVPDGTALERKDWEDFVRHTLNLLWVRAEPSASAIYQRFLEAKYTRIDVVNRLYGTAYASFDDIPLIQAPPMEGIALSDWESLLTGWRDPDTGAQYIIPSEALRIHSIDFMFRDYLQTKYPTLERLNRALGTSYLDRIEILPPQRDAHMASFLVRRGALRREFITRNFRTVLEYLVFHGRGLLNTAIYCTLAVLCALIVNPLAAYAMSRYRMPSNYKILLILMLTMAFPPMVTQIPVFLMLRQFNLLNTFAALILPGLANGYSIFLLKGFFDSLPRELYESAAIDGASEWTMFWGITMNLSKPILSVIALQAFTVAYANFMFALLICQDEKMWTLMVWLYQLQQRSGQAVVYASLIIAAIPTFIIFALCQNIIIRGIVVPVEK
ncbi:MAG: ABC transporter permease subunit [Spartobacteria bacterium]|nr:ABC transporter permease subunit [Spartobacteria bacterium]